MAEEYVYHVDENDEVIGRVTRKEMRQKNLRHRGVRFFVFNKKSEILVTKRTRTKDVYPGLLEANQAGCVIYGDTYEDTVKREIQEELGIKNPKIELLFECRYEDDKNKGVAKVYKCTYGGKIISQKEEVDDYFFVPAKKLKEMTEKSPEKFTPDSVVAFKKFLSFKKYWS